MLQSTNHTPSDLGATSLITPSGNASNVLPTIDSIGMSYPQTATFSIASSTSIIDGRAAINLGNLAGRQLINDRVSPINLVDLYRFDLSSISDLEISPHCEWWGC
ncbi:MAG: hypothetical protein HC800_24850 [Phormidesmis sp. RL_2_1]|nr:hypothetical protein [Phormidesmis sp. RL_2_1]